MPIATPTMPPSAIGVSNTRAAPYFACSPSVQRKTPPKKPTSSPNTTTFGSLPSITSIAARIAWIIVIAAMSQPRLFALPAQVWRHRRVDVVEHRRRVVDMAGRERAVAFRLLLRCEHVALDFLLQTCLRVVGPRVLRDHVPLESRHGVAQREMLPVVGGTVFRRIVGGRVRAGAVGYPLDQRRAGAAARALDRPPRRGDHCKEIVAVDPQRGDAVADAARRERRRVAAGDALE